MKSIFCSLLLILPAVLAAQQSDTLTLEQCRQQARENYPLARQQGLLSEAAALKIRNLSKNWFPQIYLNAQATYQSDVTQVSIPIPGIQMPELYKDMYKIALDVNQVIYDGGFTAKQKNVENLTLKADQQSLQVELNKINERVNQLYFNILLSQANERLLLNVQEEIRSKLKKTEAAVKNEALIQTNADILKAELLKTDQQLIEARAGKLASVNMLGEFLNRNLPETLVLTIPENITTIKSENQRPEMQWYDLQMDRLDATRKISSSKLLPRISFFGQAGYGRPGLNMLDPDFNGWYMTGMKVSWNIWNWNLSANERKIIDIQKDILLTQKETFDRNIQISQQKDLVEIQKYSELILKDQEIVVLREKIAANYSVQFDNGIITATEYTTELNAAAMAKLNMQLHVLQQQMAVENLKFNSGK